MQAAGAERLYLRASVSAVSTASEKHRVSGGIEPDPEKGRESARPPKEAAHNPFIRAAVRTIVTEMPLWSRENSKRE
ncbi:hypothetical protein EYF80_055135 [Liparis tanakae]|uniref:Uncharacterized protein n=1 Tax=Liparis tanakae TaxID=230148 RepID=A0A4Z2F0G6_9TELE|nr:hypothetical protein EYF80_055135 [Liparis tanakae]